MRGFFYCRPFIDADGSLPPPQPSCACDQEIHHSDGLRRPLQTQPFHQSEGRCQHPDDRAQRVDRIELSDPAT